jgi:ABC-type nickel/cobalt efflux system permease component RcnA
MCETMIADLNTLLPLYLFACWHVMMPGHGKTLLVAVCLSGNARSRLLPLALGYGLSHGLLMAAAALAGLLLTHRLSSWVSQYGLWIKNIYLPLLLGFGLYFMSKARRTRRKTNRTDDEATTSKSAAGDHPFSRRTGYRPDSVQ